MNTDPIADMLTRIRNAYSVGKDSVDINDSKLKLSILEVLKQNDYIEDFKKDQKMITVALKYQNGKPAVSKIERVSKPGRRVYVKSTEIPVVLSGRGITIVSTSKGILAGVDAKKNNLGGEIIAKVY